MNNVPCTIDLEATQAHFHAHVVLDGYDVEPGDGVLVHGTPSRIPLGTVTVIRSRATVVEASRLKRALVRLVGWVRFYELYDVGFEG
jgi:hypothetical protein